MVYLRNSFTLRLNGEVLECYAYQYHIDESIPAVIKVTNNPLWDELMEYLRGCNWKGNYDSQILDGTQWGLKFVTQEVTVDAEGFNAYPPGFNKFLSLLNHISGLDMQI